MRKVVLYTLASLDGVVESPDRYVFEFDEEMRANLGEVVESQDVVLLGRRTYDMWAVDWPGSEEEPFGSFINNVQKYVLTSTIPATTWSNSTVVEGSVGELIGRLKGQPGGHIGVHGSIELARSLIQAGLVDELRMVITPTIAGQGRHLLDHEIDPRRLTLLAANATSSGALLVTYRISNPADVATA